MYLTRSKTPTNWPISRKGTAYVVSPNFNPDTGLPLLIVLRDVLSLAKNRRETKKALKAGNILINNKKVSDDRNVLSIFDNLSIVPLDKHYRISISEKGRFKLEKVKKSDTGKKVDKVIKKTLVRGGKIQVNFLDGKNIKVDKKEGKKINTNDSAIIDFEKKKIEKILPLKEKANVLVTGGKHAGETGKVEEIDKEHNKLKISKEEGNIESPIKYIIVVE